MSEPSSIKYTGNSHNKKADPKTEERPKMEKIVQGTATERKRPVRRRLVESFVGDDLDSVTQYVIFDVIVPAAKTTISDAVAQGVERLLFGDGAPARKRTSQGHTSYSKIYSNASKKRDISNRSRAAHDFKEIVLETRIEAVEVLDRLGDLIESYDVATVADLYDLVGITGNFTDAKWGWTDLRGSSVTRVREGYLISVPRPIELD